MGSMFVLTTLLVITYMCLVVISTIEVISNRLKSKQEWEDWKNEMTPVAMVITVDVLAVLAVIDIFGFEFCRNTLSNYRARKRKTHHENFRHYFGSVHEPGPRHIATVSAVTLRTADEETTDDFMG